jgi:hypothetical protein
MVPFFLTLPAVAQIPTTNTSSSFYGPLDNKARYAKDNATIRELFQEIHDLTLFGPLPPSIHERLVRSQRSFLEGKQAPVTEGAVADAVNFLGRELDAATFTRTNAEQVRLLRIGMFLKLHSLLVSPTPPPPSNIVGNDLSPAGGVFLACLLLRQKLGNPAWFGDANAQNKQWLTTVPKQSDTPASSTLTMREEAPELHNLRLTLTTGLADERSKTTQAFHHFFDTLGIEK